MSNLLRLKSGKIRQTMNDECQGETFATRVLTNYTKVRCDFIVNSKCKQVQNAKYNYLNFGVAQIAYLPNYGKTTGFLCILIL